MWAGGILLAAFMVWQLAKAADALDRWEEEQRQREWEEHVRSLDLYIVGPEQWGDEELDALVAALQETRLPERQERPRLRVVK